MAHYKFKLQMIIVLCVTCLFIGNFAFITRAVAKADLPYYIKVNKQQNCVTVYEKDKNGKYTVPVKSMVCSVGEATPLGIFKTPIKYRWKLLMGDVWGQYSTRIVGGILFHSVWYYRMDASTLSATQYNKLGTTASHGCVRLTVADAKWIYDNCPIGTTVEIYNSKDPGPLGKPVSIKLSSGTGWDPTDPSDANPFHKKVPTITGIANKSIEWGTTADILKGVKALSTTGMDITKDIEVKGEVNPYKAGIYKIEYTVSDQLGRATSKMISITVKKSKQAPVIKGITDRVVGNDTIVDRKFAMKGVAAYLSTYKIPEKNIKVTIKKTEEHRYDLTYYVKAENNKTAKKTAVVYLDSTPPTITGIYFKEMTKEQLEAGSSRITKLALKGIQVSDDYDDLTIKDVKISLNQLNDYTYEVTYTLSDRVGNTYIETVQFAYFSDIRIEGVLNVFDIPYGTEINEAFVKRGVLAATKENEDCTENIMVDINTSDNKVYFVTYSIQNMDGSTVSLTCQFVLADKPDDYVEDDVENDLAEEMDEVTQTDETNTEDSGELIP